MVMIRSAHASDAQLVGKLMADAFRDDPTWSVYYPDDATRPAKLEAHYSRRVRRHPELAEVAVDDGRVVGALMWEEPHSRSQVAALLRSGSRIVRRLISRLPGRQGIAHTLTVEAHRPTEPHWYIHDIAASPQARGKGVGSALLGHRLSAIDAAADSASDSDDANDTGGTGGTGGTDSPAGAGKQGGIPHRVQLAALESTTAGSRRLYERFGFEAVAEVTTQPGEQATVMVRRPT